jgi:hypothetical protein
MEAIEVPRRWAFLRQRASPLVFFFLAGLLFGQEGGGYRIGEDGRFFQYFRWSEQENVLSYELEFEKREGESWENVLTAKTGESFLETSLAPGSYRYRIRVFDLLGRSSGTTEWIQFEILPAKEPELDKFSPEAFYLAEDSVWELKLWGRSLTGGVEIYLQNREGKRIRPRTVTVEESEEEVLALFHPEDLAAGDYTIHAVNPGGLEAALGTFRIIPVKPVDIIIGAGYRPMVPLYGLINELFGRSFFPLGAYVRLGLVHFRRQWGHIGFELEPSWNYLSAAEDDYTVQAHLIGGAVYGVYRRRLANRVMTVNARIGGGIYSVLDYHFTFSRGESEPVTILIPAFSMGVSLQWFIRDSFFVEAGMDFTHMFTAEDPPPGYLRPFAGAGWQF